MTTYVVIGVNSVSFQIADEDYAFVNKIYLVGNEKTDFESEDDKIEVVKNMNVLDLCKLNDFDKVETPVIFVDYTGNNNTYLDLMFMLNTSRFENRSYYIGKDVFNPKKFPLKEHFNPWLGEELPLTLTSEEREQIGKYFTNLILIIKSYLKSGFHEKKILSVPDGWMMNFATPELHHIVHYYGLEPIAEDMKGNLKNLDFLHNSQYRQIVTKTLIHVVVNYLVRNKMIQNYIDVDWFNPQTWTYM